MLKITKQNPLYFPKGNEFGEHWEPCFKAELSGFSGFGRTPEAAKADLEENRIKAKREAVQARIDQAAKRVEEAIAQGFPAYIIRSRRNSLAVACSDAALLEALIKLERA